VSGGARDGDRLPALSIPIDRSLIVAAAIATRDYQPIHHDPDAARKAGSEDVFMNILTTQGLVGRYVTDWAGPNAVLRKIAIRLGASNYPGDTMVLSGEVVARRSGPKGMDVDVAVRGANRRGDHVNGGVTLTMQSSTGNAT
jgi:acyl dehydratase